MRGNSQRFFDSVPSRLRPQGTPLRMTGFCGFALRRMNALRAITWLVAVIGAGAFMISQACGVEADTFSPVVSFQYLDSLDDSPATSPIFSKVVSYQYFDWPGDENLTFQYSPNVSYYFSGGVAVAVTGTIRMSGGLPVGGALIKLKRYGTVFWTGTSDANGNFSAPGLLAADYKAVVTKAG